MDIWRTAERAVIATVLVTVVVASPAVGLVDVTQRNPTTIGNGDAAVTVESLATDQFGIERGRFGTRVDYLRIPAVTLRIGEIRGTPKVVYRTRVPDLRVDRKDQRLLTSADTERISLSLSDRALDPSDVTDESYRARVTVRVQSFEVNRYVLDRNVTVEVAR